MLKFLQTCLLGLALLVLLPLPTVALAQGATAAQDSRLSRVTLDEPGQQGRLVSVAWLQGNLARTGLRVLDASPAAQYRKQHIAGAISADFFAFGPAIVPLAQMQQRLRSWGVNAGQPIVIYDEGGTYMAPRLFWDLVHAGLPAEQLFILDGGMAKWLAGGGAVTQDSTVAPTEGSITLSANNPQVRVQLPEFLAATGDPRSHVLLEALDPEYFFGGAAFFNRSGHVPHATLMPAGDFYNADKTFKSRPEIQRMLDHLGIRPEQQIHTYCGGGGAAAVPFFALKYMLNYPQVKLFQESQLGWLQDARELPVWTYGAPQLLRDTAWLKTWASPMLKGMGFSKVSIVDLRPDDAFKLGHMPLARSVPATLFRSHLQDPAALAEQLGKAGLDRSHEAVLVADGGLQPAAALAFVMLENLGQQRVSIYTDNLERWIDRGLDVARPVAVAAPSATSATATRSRTPAYDAQATGRLLPVAAATVAASAAARPGAAAPVFIASGAKLPVSQTLPPAARVLHLPYTQFLQADGTPRAAKDIWALMDKAGVPRYAELVFVADEPGEAAVNYVVFRLMGFAQLKLGLR